jgi:hypothetical protein
LRRSSRLDEGDNLIVMKAGRKPGLFCFSIRDAGLNCVSIPL